VLLVKQAIARYDVPVLLHVVHSGDEALEYIDRAENQPGTPLPELILLDLNLPGTSGIEVLSRLRAGNSCTKTPVVVFTSSDSAEDRRRVAELGARSYFRKPSNYEEFMKIGEVLNEVLGGRLG
jgi:two-component system, chemotaxis family, response regulator Rcp1